MSHEPYSSAPWPSPAPSPGPSRLLPILGVALGLLGLAVGTAAWFRAAPSHSAAPAYSDQQVAEAKKAVCEAYAKGMRSIRTVASRKAENDGEKLAVVTNSEVGEALVSTFFLNTVESNPASPGELQSSLRKLATEYQNVALTQLADGGPADYQYNIEEIDAEVAKIDLLCQ